MDVVRIGHGNIYINNHKPATAIAIARQCKPDSWGFNEAYKIAPRLDKLKAFDNIRARVKDDQTSKAVKKDMWDAKDCQTIVRKVHDIQYHSIVKASKDVAPYALGHDRTITTVAYKKSGFGLTIAHVNIHPNPINMYAPNKTDAGLIREHTRSMHKLDAVLTFLEAMGYAIVLTGDVNITQAKARHRESPTAFSVAKKHNLNAWADGLDAIFWDKRLRVHQKRIIPQRLTGADHPWFWFDFKVA